MNAFQLEPNKAWPTSRTHL